MNAARTFLLEKELSSMPTNFLRLESLLVGAVALVLFSSLGGEWSTYFLWLAVPDLAMVGYALGPRRGAVAYNMSHNYAVPAALALWGVVFADRRWVFVALLWTAHVAIDRLMGFGLKYPTRFTDTHLGRV